MTETRRWIKLPLEERQLISSLKSLSIKTKRNEKSDDLSLPLLQGTFIARWLKCLVSLHQSVKKGTVVGAFALYVLQDTISEETEYVLYQNTQPAWALKLVQSYSELTSPEGRITAWKVKDPQWLSREHIQVVEIEEPCSHAVQLHGLCALCGHDVSVADFTGTDTAQASISMTHSTPGLRVSNLEAERVEKANKNRLLQARQLSLVLDLDQTVLHATIDPSVMTWLQDSEHPNHVYTKEIVHFQLPDGPATYFVKWRPHLQTFLRRLSSLYEMHIYTMGTRAYAHQVAHCLDPTGEFFHDRILSRDDSGSHNSKNLQRLFPVDDGMVVVVDDRSDVWQWSPNLVAVKPYDFFKGIGDIHAPGGNPPISNSSNSINSVIPLKRALIDESDDTLLSILRILEKVHYDFYENYHQFHDIHVKNQLQRMKRSVFENNVFLLSGLIPLGTRFPEQHELVRLIEIFGGKVVHETSNSRVTHLITASPNTAKVAQVKSQFPSVPILKPDWLFDSLKRWEKQKESDYIWDTQEEPSVREIIPPFFYSLVPSRRDEPKESPLPLPVASSLNWDEMEKEMEEAMNESDDSDFDEMEDEISNENIGNGNRKRRRNSSEFDSDEEALLKAFEEDE